jgi:hypothetical protein
MKAFPNILERNLAEVGLHGQYGLALHLRECGAVEAAGELEVGKRCSGVLVLIHLVVMLLSWAGCNVEHVWIGEGEDIDAVQGGVLSVCRRESFLSKVGK